MKKISLFYLKEAEDTISFYLLFLKKEQSAERILLLIEDVLPSRLQNHFLRQNIR
ncbi:CRISPR-associated protein (cas_TM1802) [Candidatus Methanoperedenaceae archaeon GB37]|nr:CRISPR-associated protein (cas_TM1802) [Candidatus Methanoperedenaceae archaeon GB37]